MTSAPDDIVLDLVAEYDRIEAILSALSPEEWLAPSAAPGWSVADTVLHLALSEAGVATTLKTPTTQWTTRDHPLDEAMHGQVRSASLQPRDIFEQ
jgi:uncharacterized damage-inducible protein DinB